MEAQRVLGGRYELMDRLGAGGMAVVWRASDRVLGRTVAVKVLAGRYAEESGHLIRAEARAAATLAHPNIAQVYDYGEADDGGPPYVVMELVRGSTLELRMAAGPVTPPFAMRVSAEVAAALAAAHADGLVHRDIKPANVMLTPTGAKVVDFGLAAAIDPDGSGSSGSSGSSDTADFEVFGTPAYVAPERLLDDAVTPASDVYALGLLLYRLLSGHSPWSADTTTQMLAAHIYVEPEPLPAMPGVPEYVTILCNRCLSKDPTQRPSARDAAAVLARGAGLTIVEDDPVSAAGNSTAAGAPSLLIRREPAAEPASAPLPAAAPQPLPAAAPQPLPAAAAEPQPSEAQPSEPQPSEPQPAEPQLSAPPASVRRGRRVWLVAAAALLVVAAALLWISLPAGRRDGRPAAIPPAVDGTGATRAPSPEGSGASAATPTKRQPTPRRTDSGAAATAVPGRTAAVRPQPTGEAATTEPAAATTTADSEPQQRTLTSTGGSVEATCPGADTAELTSWTPVKPYKVDDVQAGPADAAVVVFRHGNRRVRMTVTCSGGVPSTTNAAG